MLQILRLTQLSASDAHAQARQDARIPSSASASRSRKPRSSRAVSSAVGDVHRKVLEEVATKLVAVGFPWKDLWAIHGSWVVASVGGQDGQQVTGTDALGAEVLSYVPQDLVHMFLLDEGQSIVSVS